MKDFFRRILKSGIAYIIFLTSILGLFRCSAQKKIAKYFIEYNQLDFMKDSALIENLMIVDSIVKANNKTNNINKAFYCPVNTLIILEAKTGIHATADKSFIGPKFTLRNWIEWHKWFNIHFRV